MSSTILRKGVAALAVTLVLAACGQASADIPSEPPAPSKSPAPSSPAVPSQPAEPSPTPSPTPVATPKPAEQPPSEEPVDPHKPNIVRHRVPMIGRVTADGVAVRALPDLDAPLVTGGSGSDEYVEYPNLRVDAGQEVIVTLGPVYADGLSWYYGHGPGNGEVHFLGWIAGEFLASETVSDDSTGTLDGFGNGGALEADVAAGTSMRLMFGVNVVVGDDAFHFAAEVVLADGSVVNVADQQVTGPMLSGSFQSEFPSVHQAVGGTLTLRVSTDCSFAASMGAMGH